MGCFDECQETIDNVLLHAVRIEDKIPVYFTLVEMLSSQGRMKEAINLCIAVLNLLGEPIPRTPGKIQVLNDFVRTRRLLRGKSDEDILNLPDQQDGSKIAAMKLLGKLSHLAWWTQDKDLLVTVCLRSVGLSLRFGLHDSSAHAFALFASILVSLANSTDGCRFAKLGLTIMDRRKDKSYAARTMVIAYMFSVHHKCPLQEVLNPMMSAYKIGMESGDVEYASQACNAYSSIYIMCGLPLAMVEPDMRRFAEQMHSYNQFNSLGLFRIFWQTVLNFMGRCKDPMVFEGEAMQEKDLVALEESKQMSTLIAYWLCRMMLAYHFGDYHLAGRMAEKIEKNGNSKMLRAVATGYARRSLLVLTMISLAALARRSARKTYLKRARKHCKIIESMVKEKNVNCHHALQLIRAEFAALKAKSDDSVEDVRKLYDKAIASAARLGFLQDAALANQRAGFYMLKKDYQSWGEDYIRKSHELYTEWGALSKTRQLEKSFKFLNTDRSTARRSSGTYHLARRRFNEANANQHRSIVISSSS